VNSYIGANSPKNFKPLVIKGQWYSISVEVSKTYNSCNKESQPYYLNFSNIISILNVTTQVVSVSD